MSGSASSSSWTFLVKPSSPPFVCSSPSYFGQTAAYPHTSSSTSSSLPSSSSPPASSPVFGSYAFSLGQTAASGSTSSVSEIKTPVSEFLSEQKKKNETVVTSSDSLSSFADAAGHKTTCQHEAAEEALSLKVAVEKKNNRVVFAESNNDFVDVVFSFLTLPIGCVLGFFQGKSPTVSIGCMKNLYASVSNLNAGDFATEACKDMLLHPRTSSESQCRKLKLKYDEKLETMKCFYFCRNLECRRQGTGKLSEIPNPHCHCCGQLMDQLATLSEQDNSVACGEEGGVFVRGGSNLFLVTNSMQVLPGSGLVSIELLKKLGITDADDLEIYSVSVSPEEVQRLLGLSIISRTPLTDWILSEQDSNAFTEVEQGRSTLTSDEDFKANGSPIPPIVEHESSDETSVEHVDTSGFHVLNNAEQESTTETSDGHYEMNESQKLKLLFFVSKSQNIVLYAECDEDFVNFLFSFLTFPLGSVLKLLDGNSQLGSFDNLYRSVTDLNRNGHLKSEELKDMLLCPKLAPFFACDNQLLQIEESCHPEYKLLATGNDPNIKWFVQPASDKSKDFILGERVDLHSVINPRSAAGESKQGRGFVKGPAKFMVTDDLTVSLFSPTETIPLIGKSNVPITDIDAISVDFGVEEAKCFLRAALISKTALTDVFILMQAKSRLRATLIPNTTLTDAFREKTSSNMFHIRVEE